MRTVVLTAFFQTYNENWGNDRVAPIDFPNSSFIDEHIYITNVESNAIIAESLHYRVIRVTPPYSTGQLCAKHVKWQWRNQVEADRVIWKDSYVRLQESSLDLLLSQKGDLLLRKHPTHSFDSSVQTEIDYALFCNKISQEEHLKCTNFAKNNAYKSQMWWTSVMLHINSSKNKLFCNETWNLLETLIQRDQICIPFALCKTDIDLDEIDKSITLTYHFSLHDHQIPFVPSNIMDQIVSLVNRNPGQLSVDEQAYIAKVLMMKGPCKFTSFLCGLDVHLWVLLNQNGTNTFVENEQKWIDLSQSQVYESNTIFKKVEYQTTVKQSMSQSDEWISRHRLFCDPCDVAFVDGPAGFAPECPGRIQSAQEASLIAHDVLIHDCDRPLEKYICDKFFGKWQLVHELGRLRHYTKQAKQMILGVLVDGRKKHALEIGCWKGDTTKELAQVFDTVTCVDPWDDEYVKGHPNFSHMDSSAWVNQYQMFQKNTVLQRNRIIEKRGYSQQVLPNLPESSFDFIYVDGDHSEQTVDFDAKESFRVAKKGAQIVFDDYYWNGKDNSPGPEKAIDRFLENQKNQYSFVQKDNRRVCVQKN